MQFTQGLHRANQLHPNKIATLCEGRSTTFTELTTKVAKLAGGLKQRGIPGGAPVALLGFNSDFYLCYYLACAWGGFTANPVNFRWNVKEIVYSLNDSKTHAIILDDNFAHLAEELLASCPELNQVFYCGDNQIGDIENHIDTLVSQSSPIEDVGVGGDDLFGIFYTGGTTGFPKGVMLSHKNLCSSALGFMAEGAFPEGCIGIHVAPMFHLADMSQTVCMLLRGSTHVMLPNFSVKGCLEALALYSVSDLLLVPTMLQVMINDPSVAQYDLNALERVYYGGSPFTETGLDTTLAVLPGVKLMQIYGMTESSATISILPWQEHGAKARAKGRLRSAGRAFPHTQIRIVDNNDQDRPVGKTGEIIFRSPGVMMGYVNKANETDAALKNGWMHTGDAGFIDLDGFLYVVDRVKDMIISGGENIYCTEVENAIASHPAIASVAVFGVPDDEWGERVHAALVIKSGSTISYEELVSHCRSSIAGYKCPKSLSLHDALPLTGAGKIKKNELRDQIASQ
ncbi:AMP-binding protein [Halioxenophilus aromaticivorans]|uniref:Long-chain fatty acid--CoA ligase n=1 Tax=Halioxenophilus aromaticivorans TaxID=1306992 RepID=A0AAV3TXX8_9ALTE